MYLHCIDASKYILYALPILCIILTNILSFSHLYKAGDDGAVLFRLRVHRQFNVHFDGIRFWPFTDSADQVLELKLSE